MLTTTATGLFGLYDNTASAYRLVVDSSGNVMVGGHTSTHSPVSNGGSGVTLMSNGQVLAGGEYPAYFNRENSDGDIIVLRKDGAAVGSIGVNSGDQVYFAASDGMGIKVDTDNTSVEASNASGADNDNAVNLGSSGTRWKDLYLSGGVYLGGAVAANKLDDYEEGNHSATFGMNGSGSISMLRQNIGYVKVGRLVTITGEVAVSSVSSPVGSMTMTLPFTISANVSQRDTFFGAKPVAYRVPHNQDNTPIILGNTANAFVTFVYEQDNAPFADYTPAANATFNMSFSYLTSA